MNNRAKIKADLSKWDSHELAWAAGFFDGEGNLYARNTYIANKHTHNLGIVLHIPQVDPRVLHRFKAAVLDIGTVSLRGFTPKGNQKTQWLYRTQSFEGCQAVCSLLWKYLSPVKKDQIEAQFYHYHKENQSNIKWRG